MRSSFTAAAGAGSGSNTNSYMQTLGIIQRTLKNTALQQSKREGSSCWDSKVSILPISINIDFLLNTEELPHPTKINFKEDVIF